jgi:predicted dehydrogenase
VALAANVTTQVRRRAMPDGREIDVDADDTTALLLRFASGASAVLSCSVVGAHTRGMRLDLFGEAGTLICETGRDAPQVTGGSAKDAGLAPIPLVAREPKRGAILSKARSAAMVRAQALMLEDWLANLRDPEAAVPTLRAGWRVQKIIEAARRSAEGAGWVDLA